jgi:hypothetical protein
MKGVNSRGLLYWNLINTGKLLMQRLNVKQETASNLIIIRPDFFHLKTFAK